MIVWAASAATPQFNKILRSLSLDHGVALDIYFLHRGSRGRGWGSLNIDYPHTFVEQVDPVSRFRAGLRVGLRRSTTALVAFGYSDQFAQGLLLAARIRRLPVFTQSDSDFLQHRQRPLLIRTAKQAFIRMLFSRQTRVWSIGSGNSKYWACFGLTNQAQTTFESPIPDGQEPWTGPLDENSRRTVLYVGRITPEKGINDLVAAVDIARRDCPDIVLRLVGTAVDRTTVDEVVGPVQTWIELAGAVPHQCLAREYRAGDALVLPSLSEPYGLVVREALQFGLPVVATTVVPAARELCDRGWNLVPPRSPHRLAGAIRQAIDEGRWASHPPVDNTGFYSTELSGHG